MTRDPDEPERVDPEALARAIREAGAPAEWCPLHPWEPHPLVTDHWAREVRRRLGIRGALDRNPVMVLTA